MSARSRSRLMLGGVAIGVGAGLWFGLRRAFAAPAAPAPEPAPERQQPPTQKTKQPSMNTAPAPVPSAPGSSKGLLLAAVEAGRVEPVRWTPVRWSDFGEEYSIEVGEDALRAPVELGGETRSVRLPVSYADVVAICQLHGWIPPTKTMVDAVCAQAGVRIEAHPLYGSLRAKGPEGNREADRLMGTLGASVEYSTWIDGQIAGRSGLVCTVGKDWLLDPRLAERSAINYGMHRVSGGVWQNVGGAHNSAHWDYSQVLRPYKREARTADGRTVDLIEDVLVAAAAKDPRWLKAIAPFRK